VTNFSRALADLLSGSRIARAGWPPGRFLIIVPGSIIEVGADRPLGRAAPHLVGTELGYQPHIDVVDTATSRVEVWSPGNFDLLATDWINPE
jgi:hypothetical protein